jgi:hypothetical protein
MAVESSLLVFALVCLAPQTPAQSGGVATPWDVRQMVDGMEAQVKQLMPMLDQMKPDDWVKQGAPYAYVQQWQTLKTELGYFQSSAEALAKQPDKMPVALDTYFRLESLQTQLGSLIGGVRKYHNPAVADVMQAFADQGSRNHDQMRQFVLDLANDKEHEFQVMDKEAQRCRGILSRQPVTSGHKEQK